MLIGEQARGIVLLSGGIDSSAACRWLEKQGCVAEALLVRRGGRGDSQRDAAVLIAEKLGICIHILDIESPSAGYDALVSGFPKVYSRQFPDIRPFAELAVWLSIGASLAAGRGTQALVLGLNDKDKRAHPNINDELIKELERIISAFTDHSVTFVTPFSSWSKGQVLRYALDTGIPVEATWSCEKDGKLHCGSCRHCQDRQEAFKEIDEVDPTIYAKVLGPTLPK